MAKKKKTKVKRPIESYEHRDKERVNNLPVGLVTPETDPDAGRKKTYAYDPHLDPQLQWAGNAEHMSFDVPTVSLHIHERIDPRTIIEAVKKCGAGVSPVAMGKDAARAAEVQLSLFETERREPLWDAIAFYQHKHGWSNLLVAGDSLLVMNSLREKEDWARPARNLKAEIDEERIEAYRGTISLPFKKGEHKRLAVKIVDDRGIESMKVIEVPS